MTLYDPCAAGQCTDYNCALYGCKYRRGHHMAIIPPIMQGCICPPTSEQTCQNPHCPRQAPKGITIASGTISKETNNDR